MGIGPLAELYDDEGIRVVGVGVPGWNMEYHSLSLFFTASAIWEGGQGAIT